MPVTLVGLSFRVGNMITLLIQLKMLKKESVSETAQCVGVLAAKPDDTGLILGTHTV